MTDKEMVELAKWQGTPEGNAYMSVRGLEFAIDDLTALSQSREGVKVIRENFGDLLAAEVRLRDLIADMNALSRAAQ